MHIVRRGHTVAALTRSCLEMQENIDSMAMHSLIAELNQDEELLSVLAYRKAFQEEAIETYRAQIKLTIEDNTTV